MEIQVNNQDAQQVTLNEEEQGFVVRAILDAERKGKNARKEYEDDWIECEKAYNCEPDPQDEDFDWQTNVYLPWSRDAVDSALAHMIQVLLPKNNQVIDISGRTNEDDPGAEVMQKYLEYLIGQGTFVDQFSKALKQALSKNHFCVKVYWRQDKRTTYEWVEEPVIQEVPDEVTGQIYQIQTGTKKRKQPNEIITYNGPWYDTIDLKDFVFFPIYGEIENTIRIHTTYKHLEDLKAQVEAGNAPYFNIDKVEQDCKEPGTINTVSIEQDGNKEKEERQGLQLKEAWIHRIKIGDKVYKNYIATIVNDKVLIRFQPNGYEMGKSPFVWGALNPDGNYLCGDGLLSPGIGLQKYGNFIANMRADELKVKLLPGYKYFDDGVFNPYSFVNRPAGLVEVGKEGIEAQLLPINPHLQHVQVSWAEVAEIKIEFENVTVPKVTKGVIEQADTTATEVSYAQNNAQGKLHVLTKRIDERLKDLMEMTYLLIYQRIQEGDQLLIEDIARVTQDAVVTVPVGQNPDGSPIMQERQATIEEMVDALPDFLPLPEVDIRVIGYQNQIRREEQLLGLERFNAQTAQDPEARQHLNLRGEMELAVDLLGLDRDKVLKPAKEVQQQQQQQQEAAQKQQDMVVQGEVMKLQLEAQKLELERQKMEMDAQLEMQKLDLEKQKLALEMARIEQEDRHAQMSAMQQQEQFDKTLASKQKETKE